MAVAQIRNRKRPAGAVKFICTTFIIFGLAEVRENVIETPTGIAKLAPVVEILRLSTDVDQSIDRTGSTEDFAAGRDDLPIVALGLRLGCVTPIEFVIGEKLAEAQWNM